MIYYYYPLTKDKNSYKVWRINFHCKACRKMCFASCFHACYKVELTCSIEVALLVVTSCKIKSEK